MPAIDSTVLSAERANSADTSFSPFELLEVSKSNPASPAFPSLPPYFGSYEAYIEHCGAQLGPEAVPKAAFDRFCTNCTAAFKMIADLFSAGKELDEEVAFCSVNYFLMSAAEGNCHVCHCLMIEKLREDGSLEGHRLGVEALGRGDALKLRVLIFHEPLHSQRIEWRVWLELRAVGGDKQFDGCSSSSIPVVNVRINVTNRNYSRGKLCQWRF